MKKKITRIIVWLTGVFILLFLISTIVLYVNREKLQSLVIREINKQLTVPVNISGVDISMRKFPSASFLFKDVYSQGAHSNKGDTLIYAERLYLQFDIWKILTSDISINRISMENGNINIKRYKSGKNNYEIWVKDTTSSSGVFKLKEVNLSQVKSRVFDENIDLNTSFYIERTSFGGKFETPDFWLENTGEIRLENLYFEDRNYITGGSLKTSFILSGSDQLVSINQAVAELNGIPFTFEMRFEETTGLRARLEEVDLLKLQKLAATQLWYVNDKVVVEGVGSAELQGDFRKGEKPGLKVDFRITNGRLSGYMNAQISDVKCSGTYVMSAGGNNISISGFSGNGRSGKINGELRITDIEDPYVVLDLKSDLDFAEWLLLFPLDTVTEPRGRAVIDLHFENKFSSLKALHASELKKARAEGELLMEEVSFRFKDSGKKVEDINGELSFSGNNLKVKRLFFTTGKSDIFLEGTFSNVLNFVLIDGQTLQVDCRVKSQDIDLQDFILSKRQGDNSSYSLSFAKSLDLKLQLGVDRFVFDKFHATDISGGLTIKNGIIKVEGLQLKADQGVYTGDFSVDIRSSARYLLSAKLRAEAISIHDLFRSFNNFDQEAIQAQNIYGVATASVSMNAEMTPGMDVLPQSVNLNSVLEIRDGRLKDYEPMLALSRFAEISELKDVQFRSLKNNISISNSEVIIPRMEISSSVLDLQIEGIHGFDNNINYTMRLKLGDVLFSKRKEKTSRSEFDEHLVEKQYGDDPFVYIKMHGSASDPEIELDKKSLGKSISRDLKKQGEELKGIFGKKRQKEDEKDPGIIYEWPEE